MSSFVARISSARPGRAGLIALVFVLELVGLALSYQFLADIECDLTRSRNACNFLRGMVLRALVVLGVAALLIRAWPATFAEFLDATAGHRNPAALALHGLGLFLMMVPLGLYWGRNLSEGFGVAIFPWLAGAVAAILGGLLWLAPWSAWTRMLWTRSRSAVPILLAAALVPDLVYRVLPIWNWQAITSLTFTAVDGLLRIFGSQVDADPAQYIIGIDEFYVSIAPQCSGVEGFALVSVFVAIYAFIFRAEVRLARFLLVMLPLALFLSWCLNILRIALLILIGARISPDIAVNGFHSYAGWLMFTCLAFGIMALAQNVAWLHREGLRPPVQRPLRHDLIAAELVPFAAFMFASTLVAALFPHAGAGMPLALALVALTVVYFLPVLRAMDWRPDMLTLAAGALVGLGWVLSAPASGPELAAILNQLPAWAFLLWALVRMLGTTILVPIVEEMFFRGYLLTRLDGSQQSGPRIGRRAAAIVVSSLAFALLHGRWLEAGLAGLVFAAVMLRRGRVTDAIWAHMVANGIVAGIAAWHGDWGLI